MLSASSPQTVQVDAVHSHFDGGHRRAGKEKPQPQKKTTEQHKCEDKATLLYTNQLQYPPQVLRITLIRASVFQT